MSSEILTSDRHLKLPPGQSKITKWQSPKYSRAERSRRKLARDSYQQQKITDFYPIVEEIDKLLKENETLRRQLQAIINKNCQQGLQEKSTSHFLNVLYTTAVQNYKKKKVEKGTAVKREQEMTMA